MPSSNWIIARFRRDRDLRKIRRDIKNARVAWVKSGADESCRLIAMENRLDEFTDKELLDAAEYLGIDVDNKFTYTRVSSADAPKLTPKGRTWIRREIRNQRLASVKRYSEVIVPILSLLVALAALLIRGK